MYESENDEGNETFTFADYMRNIEETLHMAVKRDSKAPSNLREHLEGIIYKLLSFLSLPQS